MVIEACNNEPHDALPQFLGLLRVGEAGRIDLDKLPSQDRMVVQFELTGIKTRQKRWWIVFEPDDADLCMKDPGHEIDLYVHSHVRTLTKIWMGRQKISSAVKSGDLTLDGTRKMVQSFAKWFSLSAFVGSEKIPLVSVLETH